MKLLLTAMVSSIVALLAQPIVLVVWLALPIVLAGGDMSWSDLGPIFFYSILFAVPFVLLLGVPLSFVLWRLGRFHWRLLASAGTVAGALFAGWDLPGGDSGYSSGGNWYGRNVDFVVAGVPTLYGWLSYFQSVLVFALHGLAGATAYYWVWTSVLHPNHSFKPKP